MFHHKKPETHSSDSEERIAPELVSSTQNFDTLNVLGKDYVNELNQWLHNHQEQRVVGLSSILAYRDGCREFVIQHETGDNAQQLFLQISRQGSEWEGGNGIQSLQEMIDLEKGSRIVAFTSVAASSGGVREWIVCVESSKTD